VQVNSVEIAQARPEHLVGHFYVTDPERTEANYYADIVLEEDGEGRGVEYISGRPPNLKYPESKGEDGRVPLLWNFDPQTQKFIFDWSNGGKLPGLGRWEGTVNGHTNDFVLSGHWANGKAGANRFRRLAD
jgi:hypothetical protein